MQFEELPKELKEAYAQAIHDCNTVKSILEGTLDAATNHEDFKEKLKWQLIEVISQGRDAIRFICND